MTTAKRRFSTVFAVVVVLNFLFATCVSATPNDAKDVRDVVAAFAATWNRHDLDAFGKLFAQDADFVNVAGLLWKGRQSIQAQHAYSHGVIPQRDEVQPDRCSLPAERSCHRSRQLGAVWRCPNAEHTTWCVMFVLTRHNAGCLIAAAQNTEINRTVK
jgi:hypothetical protein